MENIFPVLLIISGIFLCVSATQIYLVSKIKNLKNFSYFLVFNAIYVLFFALELKSSTVNDAKIFIYLEYIGLSFIPSFWIICTKDLLNVKFRNDKLFNRVLYGVSFFFLVIIYTNNFHHQFIKKMFILKINSLSITQFNPGPLLYLMTFFQLLGIIFGIYIVIVNYKKIPEHLKNQFQFLLIGVTIQLGSFLIYILGYSPYGIDLPAFGLIITSLILIYGIQKKYFLSILTVAEHDVFQNMKSPVIILSSSNKLINYNLSAKALFDFNDTKVGLTHEELYPNYKKLIQFVIKHDKSQLILEYSDNMIFRVSIDYIQQSSNKNPAKCLVFTDITKEYKMLSHLKIKANNDSLTSLLNRRSFEEFSLIFPNSIVNQTEVGFIMCDIDFFKKINDTYGHDSGDIVLIGFSEILNSSLQNDDVVFRYGGEEFLIIWLGLSKENLIFRLENLRKKIENTLFNVNKESIKITSSFGVCYTCLSTDKVFSVKELVNLADKELYKAKKNGRNRFEILEK